MISFDLTLNEFEFIISLALPNGVNIYISLLICNIYVSPKMRTVPVRELGSQFAN